MNRSLLAAMHVLSRSGRARTLVLAGLAALAMGCGARSGGQTTPRPADHGAGHGDVVAAAAMPYRILRSKGGQEIAEAQFYDELAAARAVCVGEVHVNPHHHWAQLQIIDQLGQRGRRDGAALALGMEMFQRPFQGIVDDFAAGRIDEEALLSRSGWSTRWGYDFALYQPLLRAALAHGMALLALNLSDELRKKVSRHGIAGLSEADRGKLPELDLEDEPHRAWFQGLMEDMGGAHGHGDPHGDDEDGEDDPHHEHGEHGEHGKDSGRTSRAERIYSVQVLWDETMAEGASAWLQAESNRRVIILAGSGHCHDSAIVRRMQRRGIDKVVSVRPLLDDGDEGEDVSAELAEPLTDYLFIMSPR
ncbi:MAG TPA: ChaN family lipoprotein [Haliangium sp.]|nr:ChaN family lipoprotein [Haliangium sp.]